MPSNRPSFFHPLRHKRLTCIVADVAAIASLVIIDQRYDYHEILEAVGAYTTAFLEQLKAQFTSSLA